MEESTKGTQAVQQSELQRNMLRAQSADSRIGRGITSGLLDEVCAGAEDFEKHMEATAKIKIAQREKQGDWEKNSLGLASAARSLKTAAEKAMKNGEVEVSAEIVDLYARLTAQLAACARFVNKCVLLPAREVRPRAFGRVRA